MRMYLMGRRLKSNRRRDLKNRHLDKTDKQVGGGTSRPTFFNFKESSKGCNTIAHDYGAL